MADVIAHPLFRTRKGRRALNRVLHWHALALEGLVRAGVATPTLADELTRVTDVALLEALHRLDPSDPQLQPRRP
jgi:hypothetical protein